MVSTKVLSLEFGSVLAIVLATYIYMYCHLILIACSCKIIMEIATANSSR